MYVKLACSVAAHLDSEILIMDEVLAVGDIAFQEKCIEKMKTLATDQNRTILYVSHNMNTIRQLCDRCIVLSEGTKIFDGEVEEGIRYYLGKNQGEFGTQTDLSVIKRPKSVTADITMQKLELKGKDSINFYNDEKLKFTLNWQSKNELKDVEFKLIIRNSSDIPVGVTYSDEISFVQEKTNYISDFEFDINNLAPDKYFVSISAVQTNSAGKELFLDHVSRGFAFEKVKTDGNTYTASQLKSWGNVKFENMKIKNKVI